MAVLCVVMLSGVLLTNALSKQSSIEIGNYTLKVPSDWKVKSIKAPDNSIAELIFEKNKIPIGGVHINGYYPGQPLYLPNHSETKNKKDIEGLETKAVLVNLDLTQPAASGDTSVRNENHLYLIFKNEKIAYEIYANTQYVNESELIKIGKSLQKISGKEAKAFQTSLNNLELKLLAYPQKYSLLMSSTPGIRISAQYHGKADKVRYSTTFGKLETWDSPCGKIEDYGQTVELPVDGLDRPVYWTPYYKGASPKKTDKISIKVTVLNGNIKIAEKKMYISSNDPMYFIVEVTPDVVIGTSQAQNPKSIDAAVSLAIKAQSKRYKSGEVSTEGHITLDSEEKDGKVKVYTIASYGAFGFENGIFTIVSGSGAISTVMTFSRNENVKYLLQKYKEPMDDTYNFKSKKAMFPKRLWDKALYEQKYYPDLAKQQEEQAKQYLLSIGRTAKVSASYVVRKLPKINVEAFNKLFSEFTKVNPEFNNFPYWLGTKELLTNGVRYIYETSQSKTSDGFDVITFKKTKENGFIVEEYQYKIIGTEPQLITKGAKSVTEKAEIFESVKDLINSKDVAFTNGWRSELIEEGRYIVEFGSLKNDPKQGIVIVKRQNRDSGKFISEKRYLTPSKHGAIKIKDFNAFNLGVVAADGYQWIFNLWDRFREIPQ